MGNMSSLYYMIRNLSNSPESSVFSSSEYTSFAPSSSSGSSTTSHAPTLRDEQEEGRCNYMCPVCQKSGKLPTISGRFYIINDTECQCNACYTIFHKNIFYRKYKENVGFLEDSDPTSTSNSTSFDNDCMSQTKPIPRDSLEKTPYRFYGYNRIRQFMSRRRTSDTTYRYPTSHTIDIIDTKDTTSTTSTTSSIPMTHVTPITTDKNDT